MMLKKSNSQIATIITFIIAVLFLFTLITINIGRIAQKKTSIDNLADSVGMSLASQLGSMANGLKQAMGIYGTDTKNCEFNWKLMLGGFLIVAGIALAVFSGGISTTLSAVGITWAASSIAFYGLASVGLAGALLTAQGAIGQYNAAHPSATEAMKVKLSSLSDKQQIIEIPIQGVMVSLAGDDPGWTADVLDMDRDGDTTNKIPRGLKWYNLRLDHFLVTLGMGQAVQEFLSSTLNNNSLYKDQNSQPRFLISEDTSTLTVNKGVDSIRWQIDANGDGIRELPVVPWMRDTLSQLLKELRLGGNKGYGINVRMDPMGEIYEINNSSLDKYEGDATYLPTPAAGGVMGYDYTNLGALGSLIGEIEDFENTIARGLYDLDIESEVASLGTWLKLLRNSSSEDWYTRLGNLIAWLDELRLTLQARIHDPTGNLKGIHDCVSRCGSYAERCAGTALCKSVGSVCHKTCDTWTNNCDSENAAFDANDTPLTCTDVCNGWDTSVPPVCIAPDVDGICDANDTPLTWINNCDSENPAFDGNDNCRHWTDDAWQGCCGAWSNCGEPCGAATCPPTFICNLPLGGKTKCCNVTPLESVSGCRALPYSNIITDSNALTILDTLMNDIASLQTLIDNFANQVEFNEAQSYDQMHEAFYLWSDFVGGVTSAKEKLNHVVYVRLDFPAGNGFKLPYITQKSNMNWGIPKICVAVANASGDFTLTVGRFDESPNQSAPLLTRFRKLLFSKLGYRSSEKTLLENETTNLQNNLTANTYVDVTNKARLKRIIRDRGIVTKVRIHYGPGETRKPSYWATVLPEDKAKRENRDIYIISTSSGI